MKEARDHGVDTKAMDNVAASINSFTAQSYVRICTCIPLH